MADGLVIIPTFNEIENIEAIVKTVFDLKKDFHVLVVDDNSPDGTADCVRNLQKEFTERLFLEVRKEKSGLGTAYIHGFKWALKNGYDYIFEMDADFSHRPADLSRLHRACLNGADVAVGSRYKKGVNVVNWPLARILLSYGASFYVKLITGMKVHDPTAFQIEMKYRAYLKKFKIEEVSIIFTDRVHGKSKMNSAIIREAIFGVIAMKFRSIFFKKNF